MSVDKIFVDKNAREKTSADKISYAKIFVDKMWVTKYICVKLGIEDKLIEHHLLFQPGSNQANSKAKVLLQKAGQAFALISPKILERYLRRSNKHRKNNFL
jgi:uncharacterized protein YfeS